MNDRVKVLDNSLVRQGPIAAIFVLAAIVTYPLDDISVASTTVFVWSMALAAVATVLSASTVLASAIARPALIAVLFIVVPALDFVAVAFLRTATGGGTSVFTSLTVLPVLWLSSVEGLRYIAFSLAGTVVVVLSPLVLVPGSELTAGEAVRLVVNILVFGTVAAVINVLAASSRAKVRLAREHEVLVRDELDRAAMVQRSLLPDANVTEVGGIAIAGNCLPAKEVGGDFFDWYPTSDGIAITLGDVMGKGVGAGLIAAAVRAAVRSAHSVDDPAEALERAADGLSVARDSTDVTFTTVFHARISNDGVLRWSDAGHGLTAILRENGRVEHLPALDVPLGLRLSDTWRTKTTVLGPSDLLVSVSDGVLDLFGGEDETIRGMAKIARGNPDPSAIVAAMTAMAEEIPHDDDVTVVALRRVPVSHEQAVLV